MTNLERWRLYNRDLFSPDVFVDWGWYSLVGAVLERRVYYDNDTNPLYANQYILLVGPPGVGKGLVMGKCIEFIRHFKKKKAYKVEANVQKALAGIAGKIMDDDEYTFSLAADSTTFESLLVETVRNKKMVINSKGSPEAQSCMYFVLDEYTSIFKQHADDMITFLQTAWTCKDYIRRTKHQGTDILKNPCFNLVGGTTPSEFSKLLRREIIGAGIMARTVIVYGAANRSRGIKLPAPDQEQLMAKQELLKWIEHLSHVKQCVRYTPEAEEYLQNWYNSSEYRLNHNQHLDEFAVRKLTHVHKLAMCMHFSDEGYETDLGIDVLKRAIAELARIEPYMHIALQAGRNELSPIAQQIMAFIARFPTGVEENELLGQFMSDVRQSELVEILQTAMAVGKLNYNSQTRKYTVLK